MAEIGIIASVIGLVSTGTKLSIYLFDFASAIGHAGAELQLVGTEVSLFCSVMQQLRGVVTHANFQFSTVAIEAAQAIMDRCQDIFDEIDGIVSGLRGYQDVAAGEIPSVDFVGRVKWTFKKSRVQVLRSTLDSCKITMLIMLTTGEFAQKVSLRRKSTRETAAEDEQDKLMAQSLIVSQQCAIEQLSLLEDKVEQESKLNRVLGLDPGQLEPQTSMKHNTASRMLNGLAVENNASVKAQIYPTRAQRASVWLSSLILGDEAESPDLHPGTRQRRLSSIDAAEKPLQLLRKWTNQGDYLDQPESASERKQSYGSVWASGSFSFDARSNRRPKLGLQAIEDQGITRIKRVDTDAISPTTDAGSTSRTWSLPVGLAYSRSSVAGDNAQLSCSQVLMDLLQEYGASAEQESHCLCIAYGGQTQILQEPAKPLALLQQFRELGLRPQLLVQRADAALKSQSQNIGAVLPSSRLSSRA